MENFKEDRVQRIRDENARAAEARRLTTKQDAAGVSISDRKLSEDEPMSLQDVHAQTLRYDTVAGVMTAYTLYGDIDLPMELGDADVLFQSMTGNAGDHIPLAK